MPDYVAALALHETVDPFKHVLQATGTLNRKLRAYQNKDQQQETKNQYLHGDRIADRGLRICDRNVQCAQQGRDRTGERAIQNSSE
jgi:hypothetical protein